MAIPLANGPSRSSRVTHYVDRLRIRHLKLLELIATHGSLTGAADALQISQPSATKMLHELEHAFGCKLVSRNVRGGTLSAAGLHALDRLKIAIGSLDATREALASQAERPLLRIGALPLAGVSLIPEAVEQLSRLGLRPRLELHEGAVSAVLDMLCAGQVDCVIGRVGDMQTYGEDRFDTLPLRDEGFEVACSPANPLARRRRLTLAQLRDAPWIASPRGSYTRQVFDTAFTSLGLAPPVPEIESPSFHTSLATAARSDLIAFAPRSAINLYVANRRIRQVSLAQPFQIDFSAFLTLRNVPELPAVASLRTALQAITAARY